MAQQILPRKVKLKDNRSFKKCSRNSKGDLAGTYSNYTPGKPINASQWKQWY